MDRESDSERERSPNDGQTDSNNPYYAGFWKHRQLAADGGEVVQEKKFDPVALQTRDRRSREYGRESEDDEEEGNRGRYARRPAEALAGSEDSRDLNNAESDGDSKSYPRAFSADDRAASTSATYQSMYTTEYVDSNVDSKPGVFQVTFANDSVKSSSKAGGAPSYDSAADLSRNNNNNFNNNGPFQLSYDVDYAKQLQQQPQQIAESKLGRYDPGFDHDEVKVDLYRRTYAPDLPKDPPCSSYEEQGGGVGEAKAGNYRQQVFDGGKSGGETPKPNPYQLAYAYANTPQSLLWKDETMRNQQVRILFRLILLNEIKFLY